MLYVIGHDDDSAKPVAWLEPSHRLQGRPGRFHQPPSEGTRRVGRATRTHRAQPGSQAHRGNRSAEGAGEKTEAAAQDDAESPREEQPTSRGLRYFGG